MGLMKTTKKQDQVYTSTQNNVHTCLYNRLFCLYAGCTNNSVKYTHNHTVQYCVYRDGPGLASIIQCIWGNLDVR